MRSEGPAIGGLVLVAVLAFIVPLLLNRIRAVRIPIAAGEILAGIIVGKSGLGFVRPDDPALVLFNFLGLASLMFLSGVEIDLGALIRRGGGPQNRPPWLARLYHPLLVGLVIFSLSGLGAYQFARLLQQRGLVQQPLFLATIIATSGVTIIMPVLKDRGLLTEPLGQVLFNTSILGDIVPLVGLSVLVAMKGGSVYSSLWILVLAAASFAFYLLASKLRGYGLTAGLAHGTAQISVRASFALMLIFVTLAQRLGVEAILGAFAAGLLLSAVIGEEREDVTHKLDALGFGLLIPVFFLMVGVGFDLRALLNDRQALLMVPLLFGGLFLVKAIPAALLLAWYPLRQSVAGMVLLTTQMSVTIAASAIALSVGAYGASLHAAVVLVAILTAIVSPVIFNKVLGEQVRAERRGFVLAGMNRMALLLGTRLLRQGDPVTAVDHHADRARDFQEAGIRAVLTNPDDIDGLAQAGAAEARFLVAITANEEENLRAARAGLTRFGVPRTVIFARSVAITSAAEAAGVAVINPDLATVALVESLLQGHGAASLLSGGDEDVSLSEAVLTGGHLVGKALRDARLPARVLVVSILRRGEKLVPNGNTVLAVGDRLTVVGPPTALDALRLLFRPEHAPEVEPGHRNGDIGPSVGGGRHS